VNAFSYASPGSVAEAVKLLSGGGAEVLAGGTDLLSLMKEYVATPKTVVNIKGIKGLSGVTATADGVRIGAVTTLDELAADKTVAAKFPALVEAVKGVMSMQLRAMGTVAGDLLQRPRCWYYRAGYGLLALDPKGESMVVKGDNRYHAILGNTGPAYYVNPSSLAPALVALGAVLNIEGPVGTRAVRASEFYLVPQKNDQREFALKADEIVTSVDILSRGWVNATYEVRQKQSLDWPLAAAAVSLKMESGKVTDADIALGHVAPIPWPSKTAAAALIGKELTVATAEAAADAAVAGAKPLSRNGYKVALARTAVKRAILTAGGMAHGGF